MTLEQLEQRVAERTAALARSEELHRRIIESLPGGVIQVDSDGSFISANAEALKFFGISLEQLKESSIRDSSGQTIQEDGTPGRVEEYPATRCLATGQPQPPMTIGVRRRDGAIVWAVYTAVPFPCPVHRGRTGAVVTFLNITQRKRAEDALRRSDEALRQAHEQLEQRVIERTGELARINQMLRDQIAERNRAGAALRESEERFRQMAENVGEVVWILDAETRKVLYISPAYEAIWGRSCQSMYEAGDSFLEAVVPEDKEAARHCLERRFHEPFDSVYRIRGRDGEIRWVRSRSAPIRDATGKIRRITGIAEDITDLKRAEAELSRLASIVESCDDAIIGKSLDGTILSWNSGAQRIYGYAAGEILGQSCEVLVPSEDRGTIAPLLQRVGRGERIESFETTRLRKDGTLFYVSLTLSSVRDSAGNIIGASEIERDITERKRLEQEVLQTSEQERRRIGQDLHDGLGQHLTGIAFLSKSLQQRLASKAADESAEAGHIADLVQQAIMQTRTLARGLHPVEATAGGLMAALQEFAARIEAFFRLECAFDCDQPVLVPDNVVATHLYRIAQEAVNNAIKHAQTHRIGIRLRCEGDRIQLTVEDDGVGIPENAAPAGLGLRIMRYRAKMLGGTLTIGPDPEGGTVVACSVPASGTHCGLASEENFP
jgi:PAS domain S-box-containing protein